MELDEPPAVVSEWRPPAGSLKTTAATELSNGGQQNAGSAYIDPKNLIGSAIKHFHHPTRILAMSKFCESSYPAYNVYQLVEVRKIFVYAIPGARATD